MPNEDQLHDGTEDPEGKTALNPAELEQVLGAMDTAADDSNALLEINFDDIDFAEKLQATLREDDERQAS